MRAIVAWNYLNIYPFVGWGFPTRGIRVTRAHSRQRSRWGLAQAALDEAVRYARSAPRVSQVDACQNH